MYIKLTVLKEVVGRELVKWAVTSGVVFEIIPAPGMGVDSSEAAFVHSP